MLCRIVATSNPIPICWFYVESRPARHAPRVLHHGGGSATLRSAPSEAPLEHVRGGCAGGKAARASGRRGARGRRARRDAHDQAAQIRRELGAVPREPRRPGRRAWHACEQAERALAVRIDAACRTRVALAVARERRACADRAPRDGQGVPVTRAAACAGGRGAAGPERLFHRLSWRGQVAPAAPDYQGPAHQVPRKAGRRGRHRVDGHCRVQHWRHHAAQLWRRRPGEGAGGAPALVHPAQPQGDDALAAHAGADH